MPNSRLQMFRFAQDIKSSLSRARLLQSRIVDKKCGWSDYRASAVSGGLIKLETKMAVERRIDL